MTKLCINCVHCKKREPAKPAANSTRVPIGPQIKSGYYCVRPLPASPVDGSPRYNETMCEDERRTGEACGPDGYYYVGAKP
jgi:hypothetical protein